MINAAIVVAGTFGIGYGSAHISDAESRQIAERVSYCVEDAMPSDSISGQMAECLSSTTDFRMEGAAVPDTFEDDQNVADVVRLGNAYRADGAQVDSSDYLGRDAISGAAVGLVLTGTFAAVRASSLRNRQNGLG